MDLTVEKGTFLPELALLQGVVDRKSTIPILSHVLLEAGETGLAMTATDLDVTIRSSTPATVAVAGSATVPAKKLFELVRTLPDAPIRLRLLENNYVQVDCDRSSFKLVALPASDYPTLPTVDKADGIALPLSLFRQVIHRVLFAVSQEEGRFQISGSLMKFKDGVVEMISTDGHRLALVEFEAPGLKKAKRPPQPVLVPKKALLELSRFEGPDDSEVRFGSSENHLVFSLAGRQLLARSLDLKFPDYEKVISKDNDRKIIVPVAGLLSALRRVAIFSNDRSRAIKLAFAKGELVLSSANPDLGEARDTLAVPYDGEAFFIGLNAGYLVDFLQEVGTSEVELKFKDENTHCLGSPVGEQAGIVRYLYLVMPMRL